MTVSLPIHEDIATAERWLNGLRPKGIQLGLQRVRDALVRLGSPHERLAAVTVAGTNGKGSTASFISAMGHSAGYRMGLYTSPHLVDVTERIRVGGMPILPADFVRCALRVRDAIECPPAIPLTYFEALTVMAILHFAAREVDVAVLEVGMGGRLDATAVVPSLVSVITPIGMDHEEFLGDTLEAIAAEKAGILHPGSTLVTNVQPDLFRDVLGPRAFELRCPIRREDVDYQWQWLEQGFRYRGWIHRVGPVHLGIPGLHQGGNAALACAAVETLMDHGFCFKPVHIADGLHRARHRGRLERCEPTVDERGRIWPAMLLDGAHNAMGAATLALHVSAFLPERPRVLVAAVKRDKDVEGILGPVAGSIDAAVVTGPQGSLFHRPEELRDVLRAHGVVDIVVEPEVPDALELARQLAGGEGGVLIAGSLYLLGEVLPRMPLGSPRGG